MAKRIERHVLDRFVLAIERGAHVLDAARTAGAAASSFYRRRARDPGFAELWDAAVEASNVPVLIATGNGRRLQKRRTRRVRFDRKRKEQFLSHFAATCDQTAAAEAAGVSRDTVYSHLRSDPAFADAWQEALETGYRGLEAEAVAQRKAALERYRVAPDPDAAAEARDFGLIMQLLTLWRKKDGTVGKRASPRGDPRARWSFDDAIADLEKKLNGLSSRSSRGGEGRSPGTNEDGT